VQRCKTLPGGSHSVKISNPSIQTKSKTSDAKSPKPRHSISTVPIVIPKGDPALGNKISHLSKEDRKKVKSSDADRVARRLAKKKAKSLEEKGVKSKSEVGKERSRERKKPKDFIGAAKGKTKPKGEKGKGRVRSNKAISKLNIKK